MNRRRRQSPSEQALNQLRDYAVPIIGLLLIVFIIYNVFSGDEATDNSTEVSDMPQIEATTSNKMTLDFDGEETTGFVEYSEWWKDKLSEKNELYPGEKLVVENGNVTLKSDESLLMKLSKNGELKYDISWDYMLSSSDLFVKADEWVNVNLRFLNMTLLPGTIVSLNQNEVASTVNVLSGKANVSSFAGKQATIWGWEKISITNSEATKEDLDIEAKREEIGNYFFSEKWATDNNLISYLSVEEEWADDSETGTGETNEDTSENTSQGKYITITGIEDNKTYGSSTLDIWGTLSDERVAKITFNNSSATLDLVAKTYELNGFSIPLRVNDIVYKAFDTWENVLERGVLTVYYQEWAEVEEESSTDSTNATEFPVTDSNPQFAFTAPTPNPFTSTADFITIRGKSSAWAATYVTVNGLRLKSYNGTTWRYHASTQFGTLKNGVNLYKVNYYNAAGTIVHTNTFTIIRKTPPAPTPVATTPVATPPAQEKTDTSDSGGDDIANRIPLE